MTFTLESLGCAKNQVDSELMISALESRGLTWVTEPEQADLILINTCGFITSAKEESIETGLELKNRFPDKWVVMAGCLVKRYEQELKTSLPELDGFVGDLAPEKIAHHLTRLFDLPLQNPGQPLGRTRLLSFPGSAFVRVADGCSNNCSYCAIPLIRGTLHSRPIRDIETEIRSLLDSGCVEINLIAQDLASYGADRGSPELPALLEALSRLDGSFWIRLLYLHPDHFPQVLPEIIAGNPRILPYFDLPFQHASATVLRRMGRLGDAETYLDLVTGIRSSLPRAVIRSTFLVGFPGETEPDFNFLLDFQKQSQLDWVGVFTYSREEGTTSHNFTPRISSGLALERKRILEEAQIPISEQRLDRQLGQTLDVLVEEEVKGEDLYLSRGYLQAPEVDGLVVLNPGTARIEIERLYPARITRRNGIDLEAVLKLS